MLVLRDSLSNVHQHFHYFLFLGFAQTTSLEKKRLTSALDLIGSCKAKPGSSFMKLSPRLRLSKLTQNKENISEFPSFRGQEVAS